MKKLFTLLLSLSFTPFIFAQNDCTCSDTFVWMQETLKVNYSGYYDKVPPEKEEAFAAHTADFTQRVAAVETLEDCHKTLLEWADFFQDGHVQLGFNFPDESPEAIRKRFADWPSRELTMESTKSILDGLSDRHPVEGIWQSNDGAYQIAVLRPENDEMDTTYLAYVLKADSVWWMPGQVKMELTETSTNAFSANYYMRNHSLREETAQVSDNGILQVSNLGNWYQTYPLEAKVVEETADNDKVFTLTRYDEQTLVLTIPTFNEYYRREMQQLVKDNKDWMEETPNWIIDCRGNGGGSDMTYFPLRPYLATGEVKLDGMQTRATILNANKYEELSEDKSFSWLVRRWAKGRARKLRKNDGKFIGGDKCVYRDKYRSRPMPQRVAVLTDGGCASSCEQFALFVDQSDKVTLMGQSTAGVLDYGNLITVNAPCQPLRLSYATTRSCRVDQGRGIDNIGIPPDVEITDDENDWIKFAADYLKGTNQ